ncbi:alpha/beta hydrolase family protein [Paludisphaera rhizosphaerae]|uniref:alpha/beta hydrolase family protein n=1 Tax=Paludisphaera rhizosphaerae TaxID=2711216 RepID=UPI0013ECC533|nr:alpha/beta fold hydrolase [Paludisphaera rhizosphaerae]
MPPQRPLLIAFLGFGIACGGPVPDDDPPRPTPGLELRDEDYAQARAGFATKLVRHGPSPAPSNPAATPPDAVAVEYQSGDLRLQAYRNQRSGDGAKRPAVLFLHGGFAFGDGDWEMSQPFRDAGFVVMTPLLRGENGQPGDFSLFYNEVDDVLAAAETLAAEADVDPHNIFVTGHSVGGTLAMLAALTSHRFRAAASMSGSPDAAVYLQASRSKPPFDATDPTEIRLRSAVAYASSYKCPIRLYCGDEEFWLQSPTQRTAILAKRSGIDAQAVETPGDHFSSVPEAVRSSINFFRNVSASE